MEIRKLTNKEWMQEVTHYIKGGIHGIIYGIQDTSVVLVHRKTQVDEAVCEELGYDIYESFNNGGTILTEAGDFEIGHFDVPGNGWYKLFADYFVEWLKDKGLNAEYIDNDILVDDYKVCGTCVTRYGRIDYTGIHIGINTNIETIKRICKKPMKKIPKGLSEYGITTEEVEKMFLDFCKQFKTQE